MRNIKSRCRTFTKTLSKSKKRFVAYNIVQFKYADKLESDEAVVDIIYKEGENSYKESAEQLTYHNTNVENTKSIVAEVQQVYTWMSISY